MERILTLVRRRDVRDALVQAEFQVELKKHKAIEQKNAAKQLAAVAAESSLLKASKILEEADTYDVPDFDTAWGIINELCPTDKGSAKQRARRRWIAAGFPVA